MKSALYALPIYLAALTGSWAAGNSSLQIEQTTEPRFPGSLAFSPISHGQASVIINVDADGKLADLLVSGYSHKAFADEAVASLKRWRYTPAQEHGKPVGTRQELRFDFSATGRVVSLMPMDTMEALFDHTAIGKKFFKRVCLPHELDQPIVPTTSASPGHPGLVAGSSPQSASVLVDFYVDEYGQPRMPVVINSPDRTFALAAVNALNQWRFSLPTRSGQPVAVRVRQEFIFPINS